jgi:preprotein translocase subunit YajC
MRIAGWLQSLIDGTGTAWAAPGQAAGGANGIMGMVFPLVLFMVIFYFLIIRPQKKKQKQHDQMLASIGRGDKVVTAGGVFGVVREILDDSYLMEVDDGVKVRILKGSISYKRTTDDAGRPKKGVEKETKGAAEPVAPEASAEEAPKIAE